jgi:ABC-type dipeptide/oligopeptide/nickel transport system permease component
MAKFIVRRLLLMLLTMAIVSVAVFAITSAAPGNVARNVLGIEVTPEQEASFLAQNGLDKPVYLRYLYWLAGTDWRATAVTGFPLREIATSEGFLEWWAVDKDGSLIRWRLQGEDLIIERRQPDGKVVEATDNGRWQLKPPAGELSRLEKYRAQVQVNPQLTDADRQAILAPLDQILAILGQSGQSQAALLAAVTQPEAALNALRDANAPKAKQSLQQAAISVTGNDTLLQAVNSAAILAGPTGGSLELSQQQFMAGQLNRAFVKLKSLDAGLSGQVQQAYNSLKAGDIAAANTAMAQAAPGLSHLTGNLGNVTQGLQAGDYRLAATTLRDLADPDKTPFDANQLKVIPDTLKLLGSAFSDVSPTLSKAMLAAVDSLNSGKVDAARSSLNQAADQLQQMGQVIARTDVAGQARVGRVFWGIDDQNHAVRWETGTGKDVWVFIQGTGWMAFSGGPVEYIPLARGLLRGDPGISLRTNRPVSDLLFLRLRNSLVLAGLAFVIVMPVALLLGIIAGLNEGKTLDRTLSIGGMMFSVTPEFATGIFLILIFAFWLKLVPGATVFGEKAPWTRPDMLILPVATLTLIELGYVLRITRASMVEVMKAPYIRTAFLKGLPYWQIVIRHAIRNALMAPITVIMLHVNWLLGGIVIVEVIFGYPGLGSYLLDSALFKDFNAIEAGAMILVLVAVSTQLLADVVYTFINPRIRYS